MSIKIRKLDFKCDDFEECLNNLYVFNENNNNDYYVLVKKILDDIKLNGDLAVLKYTNIFDSINKSSVLKLEVPFVELKYYFDNLELSCKNALKLASVRIQKYHMKQKIEYGSYNWKYIENNGTKIGQNTTSLDRIGIYVPGGLASYPSTVLMNAIPARISGVKEIIMVVPTPNDIKSPIVLASAFLSGVDRVFTIGGIQAIGALTYGTEVIPSVDKIFGPGNVYVNLAKKQVFGNVGIDMIAGPSEILILCDGSVDPKFVAIDLIAQAEHDKLSRSILICNNYNYIISVENKINEILPFMNRKNIIKKSLENKGIFILVKNMHDGCSIVNKFSPEHLEIFSNKSDKLFNRINNAGSIFIGYNSSECIGDYCAGLNHVLPTSRTARFSSSLGIYDFLKRSNFLNVSDYNVEILGKISMILANAEGLQAHKYSAKYRIDFLSKKYNKKKL